MKPALSIAFALLLAACGNDDQVASNGPLPDLATMSETPGDWSALDGLIGRTPADSGLFVASPITVDLNAMLGPSAGLYRTAMGNASRLDRLGSVLVTIGEGGQAFLTIQPADHAIEAGIRIQGRWRLFHTPGAQVPRPAVVTALLAR